MVIRLCLETSVAACFALGLSVWGIQSTAPAVMGPGEVALHVTSAPSASVAETAFESPQVDLQRQLVIGDFEGLRLATMQTLRASDWKQNYSAPQTAVQAAAFDGGAFRYWADTDTSISPATPGGN